MRAAVVGMTFVLAASAAPRAAAAAGDELGADTRISYIGPDSDIAYGVAEGVARVAYNSTANEYLVVWSADDPTGPLVDDEFEIYAQRVDATSGTLVGARIRVSDMGPDGDMGYGGFDPAVAYNSQQDEYLIAWFGWDNTGSLVAFEREIFAQRLDGDGSELGVNDLRISDMGPDGDANYNALTPNVVFNPLDAEYLVTWSADDDTGALVDEEFEVYAQRVDAAGVQIGPNDQRISAMGSDGDADFVAMNPSVSFNAPDGEYLIAWWGDDDLAPLVDNETEIFVQRLDRGGAEIGADDQRISDMGPNGATTYGAALPTVAFNAIEDEYLVAWWGDDNIAPLVDNELEIFVQRLTAAGVETGTNDQRISDMGPNGATTSAAFHPTAAFNAAQGEYIVAWQGDDTTAPLVDNELEIYAQRLTAQAVELGTNDQRISDMGTDGSTLWTALRAQVALNTAQGDYLVIWSGDDNTAPLVDGEFEIFGQRYDGGAGLPSVEAGGPYSASFAGAVEVAGNIGGDSSGVAGTSWTSPGCAFAAPAQLNTTVSCSTLGEHVLTLTVTLGSGHTISDAAVVTVGLCPASPSTTPFTDIGNSFAAAQIACLYNAGIVAGTSATQYAPAAVVTREQMAVFLIKAYETATGAAYTGPAPDQFTDIASSFAAERIRQLVGLGITAGTAPGVYSPAAPVTREQMAVFIVKLYAAVTGTTPPTASNPFTDIGESFAVEAIGQLVGLGITSGTTATTYSPAASVTREQMAVFIVNLVNAATT